MPIQKDKKKGISSGQVCVSVCSNIGKVMNGDMMTPLTPPDQWSVTKCKELHSEVTIHGSKWINYR